MIAFYVDNDEAFLLTVRDGEGVSHYEITTDQAEALAKDLMAVVNENRELERREKLEFNYEGKLVPTKDYWIPCKLISRKYEACFIQFEDGSMMVAHEDNVRERRG